MEMLAGRIGILALGALCALCALGCAPGRLADLRDSGRIGLGLGLGLAADAKLGDLTHPAIGVAAASVMYGSDSRQIDGVWYEAVVRDPYALYWWRRERQSWGWSLNSSGWRGVWESADLFEAIGELDEPIDHEGPASSGTVVGEELLDARIDASRWLPLPGGPSQLPPPWRFNSATDLQLGAHLVLLNARVGFNPLEFLDFALGFAGFDIAGDDGIPAR